MNTKVLLFASLALNVVLGGLLAYQYFFRPEKSDMPVVESVAPAFQMEVKDNDVVFMGESRLGACNWAVFCPMRPVERSLSMAIRLMMRIRGWINCSRMFLRENLF